MKKFNLSILALSLLLITACTKDSSENAEGSELLPHPKITLSAEEWISIAYDNPKEISEEDIKTILDNFLKQEYVAPKYQTRTGADISSLNQTKKYGLAEKMSVAATKNGEATNIDCTISEYEFELNGEKHRVIVSTDERYPKVVALIKVDESNGTGISGYCENMPKQDASEIMLNLSYEAVYRHLCEIEAIRDSLRDKTLLKISQKLNEPIQNISFDKIKLDININGNDMPSTRSMAIDFPTDQIISGCWPLVEVTWFGSNSPVASGYMPYYWDTNRVSPFDGVTAILHILSVIQPAITIPAKSYEGHGYKSSMSIDWNLLTKSEYLLSSDTERKKEMAGRLFRMINDDLGLKFKGTSATGYHITNGTTNYIPSNFLKVLQKYIACNSVTSYNLATILNSLGRARPIFVNSNDWGDKFVIDGYLKTRSTSGINSTYLHLKFGDSNNLYGGYYLVNADSSLDIDYGYDCITYSNKLKIIPECRPK